MTTSSTALVGEAPIKGIDSKADVQEPPKGYVLSLAPESKLTDRQIMAIRQPTPKQYTKSLKGRGGKELTYIPGAIVVRKLNFVFGHGNWSHVILAKEIVEDNAIVHGRLTITQTGQIIDQFGGQAMAREIAGYEKIGANGLMRHIDPWKWQQLQKSNKPEDLKDAYDWKKIYGSYVDPGDTFKGAATDSLKKCAAVLGMFSDVYSPKEFEAVEGEPEPKPLPPRKDVVDEKKFMSILRLIGKMTLADIEDFMEKLNGSKAYNIAQKKILIGAAEKRVEDLTKK